MRKDFEENENTIGYRISELRKDRGWSQKELAEKIHVASSQISRLESGATENVSTEILISAAKLFHVSADYLLGLTQVSVPKSYDISQLKLSEEAVRRILTGRIDAEILNRILEHDQFPALCNLIRIYFDGTLADGILGRNELIDLVTQPLLELKDTDPSKKAEIIKDVSFLRAQKITPGEADIEKIRNLFMKILREITESMCIKEPTGTITTAEAFLGIQAALPDKPRSEITADDVAGAITAYVGSVAPLNEESTDLLKKLARRVLEQSSRKK